MAHLCFQAGTTFSLMVYRGLNGGDTYAKIESLIFNHNSDIVPDQLCGIHHPDKSRHPRSEHGFTAIPSGDNKSGQFRPELPITRPQDER
jgi:hypothetical protein